jgi:hypothetical protein
MASVRGVRSVVLSVLICASVGVAAAALAQGYPPPTDTPVATPTNSPTATPKPTKTPKIDGCDQTGTLKKGKFTSQSEFHRGDTIVIRGKKKCAKDNVAVKAQINEGSDWILIGDTTSTNKGAYSIKGKIPAGISLGDHTIRVKTQGDTYTTTITVIAGTASKASGFSRTAGPLAAAWVALFGIAAAFYVGSRRKRRPVSAVAVEGPDVPMLDTSHFVPDMTRLHKHGPRGRSTKAAKTTKASKSKTGGAATTKRSGKKSPGKGRSTTDRPTPRTKPDDEQ